jgi:hypothetical protein
MKKIILSALTLVLAISMQAQTLDQIIGKHIAAQGGIEKLKKLKSVVMECTINAQGAEMPVKISIGHNRGFRMDMTIMGMDNYMICNLKDGYKYFPIGGQKEPEALPADAVKGMAGQFDLEGEFINSKEKGITLTLQGEEDVDGTMCHKIFCVMPDKTEKRIYIDKESNQRIKDVTKTVVNGKDEESIAEYSNFQTIDGYTMAMEMTGPMGPMKVKKYTFNTELPDSTFQLKK